MLIRLSTTFIALLLLVSLLAGIPSLAGPTKKAGILAELSAAPSRCAARVKSSPKDCAELAIDLIVYSWASSLREDMPTDVPNINEIISGLTAALNDPVINWARTAFAPGSTANASAALPPGDDPRSDQLTEISRQFGMALEFGASGLCGGLPAHTEISRQFGMALEFRKSSPLQSERALVAVRDACKKLRLDLTGALVRAILGRQYHFDMARYRDAELCYGPAASIFSDYGCHESAAIVYDNYGALGMEMSRPAGAVQNYKSAVSQWQSLMRKHPDVSRYYEMAGREYILAGQAKTDAGDPVAGLDLMEDGLRNLSASADMTKSYGTLISSLITVAEAYARRGDYGAALDKLKLAAKACQIDNDPLLAARVYEQSYSAYKAQNLIPAANQELDKRDKALRDAALAGESALDRLTSSETLTKDAQAKLFLTAERGAAALQTLKEYPKAESLLRRLLAIYERTAMTDRQIDCLRYLAAVMDLQCNPQESLDLRAKAAKLAVDSKNNVIAAQIVRDMVEASTEIGDLENALDALTELWPIIENSGNVRGAAEVLDGRGSLLAKHGRYEDAVRDFQEALARYTDQVGDPWAAAAVSAHLASALNALNRAGEACGVLRSALERIERRYAEENVDPTADPARSTTIMSLYNELAVSYVRDGKPDEARVLLAGGRRYKWIGQLLKKLIASEDPDVAAFAATVDILDGPPPDNRRTDALLADNWADFYAQCRSLSAQYPDSYNALPIDPIYGLYKSRNSLPRKTLVVEYMITSSSIYAFVCGNSKASVWQLGLSREDLTQVVTKLRRRIKDCEDSLAAGIPLPRINDWREPAFLEIREPLVSLYSGLLAPIAADLDSYQLLMFALPDTLDGVPMHALISSEKDGVPRFLIQDFEVGYLRRSMLSDLIGRDSRSINPGTDRLAVFADPAGNLAGAREEAAVLGRFGFVSTQTYVGSRATVSSFVRECDRAAVLHIALHYTADPNPARFSIQLAPEGDSDGRITIDELAALTDPHLQLVVLSACESAASANSLRSGGYAAELFSLAGAKSVMGGLWKVSDAASLKLMGDFYRALVRSRRSRSKSLQYAQTQMIEGKDYAHPFYWAAFALYGNPW